MSETIDRLNAALEGRYEVKREIGEGGMATVFLAKDLKHNRKVALKVLKPELAAVVGADRFLAEIETTANLQHPHILPLFDSGAADSFLFYVMPFVEGETLRDRLEREKQLPVDEAVRIATDVAEALHAAHKQGVIHRDIKPANILMSEGRPLVADFGIALAVSAAGGGRLTETGLSMGTPFYMSPEQASADRDPSAASDVYSLGCVLYEMLVGEPPYTGGSAQAVLAKILTEPARAPSQMRASIPPHVDAAIRKALEKLPADRFKGTQDFAKALGDPGFRHGEAAGLVAGGAGGPWKPLSLGLMGTTVVFAAAFGWAFLRPMEEPVSRYNIELPVTQTPDGFGSNVTISPDGAQIVYLGEGEQGLQLWHRQRDQLRATPVPGTSGAVNPVFSPDGQKVAFETEGGDISVVSLNGEPPLVIADVGRNIWGIVWGVDGYVYAYTDEGLARVPEEGGGALEPITALDTLRGEQGHAWPQLLPNGAGVLFTVSHEPQSDISQYDIAVADLETGEHEVVVRGVFARYAASGHLVYLTQEGTLLAAPFDLDGLELGAPVALAEGVAVRSFGSAHFALSEDGTLVYQTGSVRGSARWEFVWVTRSGQATPVHPGYTFVQGDVNFGWRLSPDETRVVFNSAVDGNEDVRIKHLPDGPEERITFSDDLDLRPLWTPDGQSVTYFSGPSSLSDANVWSRRADGTGERVLVLDDERLLAQGSWSPDGAWLVLRAGATEAMGIGGRDILAFRPGVDTAAFPLVASPDFVEGAPTISPSGRWLAYTSNETGRHEVFVRPFPDVESTRLRVSSDGGVAPVWAKSGRELFFLDGARGLVAAQFDPASGRVLAQEALFTLPEGYQTQGVTAGNDFYDVSLDGARFLMARMYASDDEVELPSAVVLVQNFFEELKRRVPR